MTTTEGVIITEANAPAVLAALYNAARSQTWVPDPTPRPTMTEAEAKSKLEKKGFYEDGGARFDYLDMRALKVKIILGEPVNCVVYDRDNGQGAGARAIAGIAP